MTVKNNNRVLDWSFFLEVNGGVVLPVPVRLGLEFPAVFGLGVRLQTNVINQVKNSFDATEIRLTFSGVSGS